MPILYKLEVYDSHRNQLAFITLPTASQVLKQDFTTIVYKYIQNLQDHYHNSIKHHVLTEKNQPPITYFSSFIHFHKPSLTPLIV